MARRLIAAVARALGPEAADAHVHFHQGATGAPACCYDPRCTRPRLDVET